MKVFVYTKHGSRKISTITDVYAIRYEGKNIVFTSFGDVEFKFDTRVVKTTIYQN